MALDREHSLLSGGLGTVLPIDLASPGACRGDTHARMDMPASAQTAWWSPRCFQAARARVSLPLLDFSLHKWAYWLAHGRPSGNTVTLCALASQPRRGRVPSRSCCPSIPASGSRRHSGALHLPWLPGQVREECRDAVWDRAGWDARLESSAMPSPPLVRESLLGSNFYTSTDIFV